jgi:hypothetical protein
VKNVVSFTRDIPARLDTEKAIEKYLNLKANLMPVMFVMNVGKKQSLSVIFAGIFSRTKEYVMAVLKS